MINGKKICYTYGVFDLLHYGHLKALKKAQKLGDSLVIGVFSDRVATSFKRTPVMTQNERLNAIRELGWGKVRLLNYLVPCEKDLRGIDIVAKAEGAGWSKYDIPKFQRAKSVLLPYTKGISTSELIKRIYDRNIQSSNRENANTKWSCCEIKSGVGKKRKGSQTNTWENIKRRIPGLSRRKKQATKTKNKFEGCDPSRY